MKAIIMAATIVLTTACSKSEPEVPAIVEPIPQSSADEAKWDALREEMGLMKEPKDILHDEPVRKPGLDVDFGPYNPNDILGYRHRPEQKREK